MESKYTRARTCVYNIRYHVVWCVRYRRKVLDKNISDRLREVLSEIGSEKGFVVMESHVNDNDHVCCTISVSPKMSVTQAVRYLKGISGRWLLIEFPDLRNKLWKGQLWNGSYFCETIGDMSEEEVARYIEKQKTCQL